MSKQIKKSSLISGLIWLVPLSCCLLSNIVIITVYAEQHKDHLMMDEKIMGNEGYYSLTQPIQKNWFMSKECKVFFPFISMNVVLFIAYFTAYYLINTITQSFTTHGSPSRLSAEEQYSM